MRTIKNKAVQFLKERVGRTITRHTVDTLDEYLESEINEREFQERMKD